MTKNTLTATAWIEAAFRALTIGGPQAIRAEAIARDLKVSKGSFYWHFSDVPSLKAQMLDLWKEEATEAIIAVLEGQEMAAPNKLRLLVEVATSDADVKYGGVLAEAAIRDWARYDEMASEAVKIVDAKRMSYLNDMFALCGGKPLSNQLNSSILYSALIGMQALSHGGLVDLKNDLSCLLEKLLADS